MAQESHDLNANKPFVKVINGKENLKLKIRKYQIINKKKKNYNLEGDKGVSSDKRQVLGRGGGHSAGVEVS